MGFLHPEALCSGFTVYPHEAQAAAECETKLNLAAWF